MPGTIPIVAELVVASPGVFLEPHRNPAPISRLPPEILENIFALCVSWFYTYEKPKNRLAWTQVCRAWQNVSLNSGRLWQHIDLNDSTCAAQLLVRSRQAPLHITATSPIKAVLPNLALHASRLRSIDVILVQDSMVQLFLSVGRDLSMLTTLFLKVSPTTSTIFLDLSLPSLRRLSLEGVSIRWEECCNLTYFSLRGYHPSFPSLSRLFALFGSSPELEYVRLEGFIPSSSVTAESPPVALFHLKDFIISSYPSVIRSILSTVSLGTQTRLYLYVSVFDSLCSIFPPIRLLNVSDSGTRYQHPPTRPKDVSNVRITRHGVCFIQNNAPAWCDDRSMYRFALSSGSLAARHVCRSLDHVVELTYITRLELNVGVLIDISLQELKSLFRDLQRLSTLCVAFNEMTDLLHVLESIDETTRLVYLPRLVKLSFGKPADSWWHFSDTWIKIILKTLRTRQQHAPALETLEFCSCQGVASVMIGACEPLANEVLVIEQPDGDSFF